MGKNILALSFLLLLTACRGTGENAEAEQKALAECFFRGL
jgi:hypothetical protein